MYERCDSDETHFPSEGDPTSPVCRQSITLGPGLKLMYPDRLISQQLNPNPSDGPALRSLSAFCTESPPKRHDILGKNELV